MNRVTVRCRQITNSAVSEDTAPEVLDVNFSGGIIQ